MNLSFLYQFLNFIQISNQWSSVVLKSLGTSLDKIKGIGPKTVELLISYFGSVKQVKTAKKEELVKLVGKTKALLIQPIR